MFVKGLDSNTPEPLMRAALVEAFSQAGQLLQVCCVCAYLRAAFQCFLYVRIHDEIAHTATAAGASSSDHADHE